MESKKLHAELIVLNLHDCVFSFEDYFYGGRSHCNTGGVIYTLGTSDLGSHSCQAGSHSL